MCARKDSLRERLDPNTKEMLISGQGFWESPLSSDEDYRRAWEKFGPEIIAFMRERYPGRRIFACDLLGLTQPLLDDDETEPPMD